MWCEERVRFYFLESERDGFLAERTSDLFQGEEFVAGGVFDEVDVGEAALGGRSVSLRWYEARNEGTYFAEESQDLEAPAVDLELGGPGEADYAVCEGVEGVEEVGG